MPASVYAVLHRALEPLHAMIYFAPEADEEYPKTGLRPGRMGYFASRSAPMGPVSPGVTAATFYNFNPALIAKYLPRAWSLASVPDVLTARLVVADRALRRLLGDEVVASSDVLEAAELAHAACAELPSEGRALFAGHADLPWPDDPHLVLWHAITLLREFRGDGHVAALLGAGLSGIDAAVTHHATGFGFTEAAAKATRGWSDEEWSAAVASLTDRGLMHDAALSESGAALRAQIESDTDRLDQHAVRTLGEQRTTRLIELGGALSKRASAAGAFPAGVFGK